jgi:hypothetical protein
VKGSGKEIMYYRGTSDVAAGGGGMSVAPAPQAAKCKRLQSEMKKQYFNQKNFLLLKFLNYLGK